MQLFIRAQSLHTLEVSSAETVAQIKVSRNLERVMLCVCHIPPPPSKTFFGVTDPPNVPFHPQAQVAALAGVPPEEQVLLWGGTPLDDDAVLGQSPLPEFATLELSTRLLGGTFRGGVANYRGAR